MITKKELIDFEEDIAQCFKNKQIKAPIHLYDGNEEIMIKIFERINALDWVLCTWRNHYQILCKGVPRDILKNKILSGKTMCMSYPKYRLLSSSIVGGIYPIATGIALGIKRQIELIEKGFIKVTPLDYNILKNQKVWCWSDDMGSETGSFYEAFKYSTNFNLPIMWVIENNNKSVTTPTGVAWGYKCTSILPIKNFNYDEGENWIYYTYENKKYPHAGIKDRVKF